MVFDRGIAIKPTDRSIFIKLFSFYEGRNFLLNIFSLSMRVSECALAAYIVKCTFFKAGGESNDVFKNAICYMKNKRLDSIKESWNKIMSCVQV